jgi:hypothetical protein
MKKILCLLTVFSFAMSACVSPKNTPVVETYSLASTPLPATSSLPQKNIIRMLPATISSEFSNSFFIYRVSNTHYITDPYRRFLASPNREISHYVETHLPALLNATVISSDNLMAANVILQENITALYADYQHKSAPQAVISMQFMLYSCNDGVITPLDSISLTEKTDILPNSPESLMAGYQIDLDKIIWKANVMINHQLK